MITLGVPVYNGANTITKTIDSILAQTKAFEQVIVYNDGSTDETKEVIDNLSLPPYFTVIHAKNGGVSRARNQIISLTKTDYLCFLDGDDVISRVMNENLLFETKSNNDIYAYNFTNVFIGGKILVNSYFLKEKQAGNAYYKVEVNKFKHETKHMTWSYCYRTDFLAENKINFNEELKVYEDIEFLWKIFRTDTLIIPIDEVYVTYIANANSTTNDRNKQNEITSLRYLFNQTVNKSEQKLLEYLTVKTLSFSDVQGKLPVGRALYISSKIKYVIQKIKIRFE